MPVIYTWWQLSVALHAYDHYTGNAPFLLAWQDGFGHRTQRLSTSAIVVAGVVLGVVFLTLIAHLVRTWYDQRVQQQQQRLAVLLAEATMLLTQSAVAAPDVTKAELAKIGAISPRAPTRCSGADRDRRGHHGRSQHRPRQQPA